MSRFHKARNDVPDGLSADRRQEPGGRPLVEPQLERTEYLELQGDSRRAAYVLKARAQTTVDAKIVGRSTASTTATTCSITSTASSRFQIDGWEDDLAGDVGGHGPKHIVRAVPVAVAARQGLEGAQLPLLAGAPNLPDGKRIGRQAGEAGDATVDGKSPAEEIVRGQLRDYVSGIVGRIREEEALLQLQEARRRRRRRRRRGFSAPFL